MGYMPTIVSMGERFGLDPDTILNWQAEKVYGILRLDFERHEYQTRVTELRKIFQGKES
jgi:hypothetical protein